MVKVMMLCGLPGSGKSTFAKSFIKQNPDSKIAYISRDEIRFALLGKADKYFDKEEEVLAEFYKRIDNETRNTENDYVIIDATHLNTNSRRIPLSYVSKDVQLIFVYFSFAIATCIERNEKRKGRAKVPVTEIRRMAERYMPVSDKEIRNFKKVSFMVYDEVGLRKIDNKTFKGNTK